MTIEAVSAWWRCPTYGRDVVSYCYLRLSNLCKHPWLTSSGVLWNVCLMAYIVLSGDFRGRKLCLFSDSTKSCVLYGSSSNRAMAIFRQWHNDNWTLINKFVDFEKFCGNFMILVQRNAVENIVCEMVLILFRACFLSVTRCKLKLYAANHRPSY